MSAATDALAAEVLDLARAKGVLIATAESCTGGFIIGALTEIAGSSDVVDRGFITYSNDAKQEMLGVKAETLAAHGAVSAETAAEMAAGALGRSRASLAVAVTGIAGPGGGSETKPVGLVWFGLAQAGQRMRTEHMVFAGLDRSGVRAATVDHALHLLKAALG